MSEKICNQSRIVEHGNSFPVLVQKPERKIFILGISFEKGQKEPSKFLVSSPLESLIQYAQAFVGPAESNEYRVELRMVWFVKMRFAHELIQFIKAK